MARDQNVCSVKNHIHSFLYDTCMGADKSLARPDWKKNNWKVAIFRPTRRSLLPRRPGWTDNILIYFFWVTSEFGRCSLFPSWSGQGLNSTPSYDTHIRFLCTKALLRFIYVTPVKRYDVTRCVNWSAANRPSLSALTRCSSSRRSSASNPTIHVHHLPSIDHTTNKDYQAVERIAYAYVTVV